MDRMIKMIEGTKDHNVLLWEDKETAKGYISIKHKVSISDTGSEIIIATSDVPDLVKALTQAALDLYLRGCYNIGYQQGAEDKAEEGS